MEIISNFIKNNRILSVIIGLVGTVLIGGLGSGAWEYLLKPLFSFTIDLILNLSILGIESFKDMVYQSIAQDFSEKNSIQTYTFITMIYVAIVLSFNMVILKQYRRKLFTDDKDNTDNTDNKDLYLRKKLYILFPLFFVLFIFMVVQNTQLSYVNNSIIQYKQLINISTPYISEQEVKIFNSRFSLIKNRADYERIINELYLILEKHNLELKRKDIW